MSEPNQAKTQSKAVTRRMIVAAAATIASVGSAHAYRHTNCFLKGTRISTATGERKIEDLHIGDMIPTVFGGMRPIEWIGRMRRTRSDRRNPWVDDARPVRVARSALAPNVPSADLFVTRGHALFIDGVLIPAEQLINGTTISLDAAGEHDQLEFYHVKLASHDVIHAEGAPCESLLRVDETMSNSSLYLRKHGETQDEHCAPIVGNGLRSQIMTEVKGLLSPSQGKRQLDLVRARLDARAAALGAQQPETVA
jgi:hypothetical protein